MAISKSDISVNQITKTITLTANQNLLEHTDSDIVAFLSQNGKDKLLISIFASDTDAKVTIDNQTWKSEFLGKKIFEISGDIQSLKLDTTTTCQVQMVANN